ncbi:MAG TPA: exodeoxyribonuclease V subunit gamma [Chitinivibrionales bacterium]|nr:exodeoxyribonuclease V subunit gamma [Chitinivibrionales bacterium]
MPLSVFFSNSLDLLAEQFAARLAQDWKDPFDPPVVIVPSAQVAHWLRQSMRRICGTDAVWTHRFLDGFIQEQIGRCRKKSSIKEERSMTSAEVLQLSVLRLLQGLTKAQYPWLYGPPGVEADAPIPERLLQLSSGISRLFLEYFSSRTGLPDAWAAGEDFFSEGKPPWEKEGEKFQRELYKKLLDNGEIWAVAHELKELRRRPSAKSTDENGPVYLFNVSGLGMAYHEFLTRQAETRDIHAFILNPCAAFWEDVRTVRDLRRERKWSLKKLKDYVPENDPDENPLLRSWGDFGKRVIKIWSERAADYANTEYLEKPALAEGENGSILKQIQRDLLLRMPGKPVAAGVGKQESDGSLEVFACKGRLRQLEVLRDWIVNVLRNDVAASQKLMLGDIGVYLPDAAACAVEIELVFGAYPQNHPLHIPWAFEGGRPDASAYAGAVRAYLALMDGAFARPQVLDFLSNPLVMEKTGTAAADLEAWTGWITALNIFRGFDAAHRHEVDGCDSSFHTWSQGINRLLLGRIAANPVRMGSADFLPYRDIAAGDDAGLFRFVSALEGLWADRAALCERLSGDGGWKAAAGLLAENLGRWLEPEDSGESAVQSEFLEALSIADANDRSLPAADMPSGVRLFLGWAASILPRRTAGRAGSPGVLVFRTLAAGNVFPFRLMALVNFGALDFPGENAPRPLDLRPLKKAVDDTDPIERNRHAFLEAVASVGERLAVFYPSLDAGSGEEMPPSSTVLELLTAAGLDIKRFRTETPLCAEEGDVPANGKVAKNPFPVMDGLVTALADEMRKNHDNAPDAEPPAQQAFSPEPAGERRRVKLSALRRWLEDPFTHRIESALGKDDPEETAEALLDEEPFETAFLDRLGLVRKMWDGALDGFEGCDGDGVAARCKMPDDKKEERWRGHFDDAYRLLRLESRTPDGFLGNVDKKDLFDNVKGYLRALWDEIGAVAGIAFVERLRLERGAAAGAPARQGLVFDHVPVKGRAVVLEGGPQVCFWEGDKRKLHLFVPVYPRMSNDRIVKYCLLPWLSAQATAVARRLDFGCVIHLTDGEKSEKIGIDIRQKEAAAYFQTALAAFLDETSVEHLPLQAVETFVQKRLAAAEEIEKADIEEWLEDDAGAQHPRYRHHSEFVDLLGPPVINDAREAAAARYGPLLYACYPQEPADREGEAACSAT